MLARQALLSMGFCKNTGVGCHFQWDLPDAGIEPTSPASPALACRFFITEPPGKPYSDSFFLKKMKKKKKKERKKKKRRRKKIDCVFSSILFLTCFLPTEILESNYFPYSVLLK